MRYAGVRVTMIYAFVNDDARGVGCACVFASCDRRSDSGFEFISAWFCAICPPSTVGLGPHITSNVLLYV